MRQSRFHRPHPEAGFNLINIAVILALCAVGVLYWRAQEQREERAATLARLEKTATRTRDLLVDTLSDDRAWRRTREAPQNALMSCLHDHSSCEEKKGLMSVHDLMGRVVFNSQLLTTGFTADGGICTGFTDSGNDACPFRFEVVWDPLCGDGCVDPEISNIHGTLHFKPGTKYDFPLNAGNYAFRVTRETFPPEPKSCAAAHAAGSRRDGVQGLRPVEGGPVVYVYCDQNRDGGGWALVANAAEDGAPDMPLTQTVTPVSNGRLPADIVSKLIAASAYQSENNVRVLLPDIDRGLTLALSTNGATEAAHFTANMPEGECTEMPEKSYFASIAYDGDFNLTFRGSGEVTYSSKYVAGKQTPGLDVCFGVRPDGRDCGVGCKSVWRGVKTKARGSVWIR